jgi:hypothetical protein
VLQTKLFIREVSLFSEHFAFGFTVGIEISPKCGIQSCSLLVWILSDRMWDTLRLLELKLSLRYSLMAKNLDHRLLQGYESLSEGRIPRFAE